MGRAELLIDDPRREGGRVELAARLTTPRLGTRRLFFSLDEQHESAGSPWADAFALGVLFPVAHEGVDLDVRGAPVSPSLLAGLEEFQRAWYAWRGSRLVDIRADEERERPERGAGAVAAFSGGVDSAYTLWSHTRSRDARAVPLRAAVMVHGFDIPIGDDDGFRGAVARSRAMVDSLGLDLLAVATNVRELLPDWEDGHGAAVAAVLTLLAGRFGTGLIAASGTYSPLILPWGSNPLTDPMLGSDTFRIVHDGAGVDRVDKVEALAAWPEALRNLRFCWAGPRGDRNCGRCRKCVHTELVFRCLGVEHALFESPPDERDVLAILRVPDPGPFSHDARELLLRTAVARGIDARWVHVLRRTVLLERAAAVAPPWVRRAGGRLARSLRR